MRHSVVVMDETRRPGERGLDLHLDLRGPRVRTALETALRDAVRSGRLAAGSLMPSSRSLARDLGIARNTVVSAYTQLVAEGWLTSRSGAGRTSPRTWPGSRSRPPPARRTSPVRRTT